MGFELLVFGVLFDGSSGLQRRGMRRSNSISRMSMRGVDSRILKFLGEGFSCWDYIDDKGLELVRTWWRWMNLIDFVGYVRIEAWFRLGVWGSVDVLLAVVLVGM